MNICNHCRTTIAPNSRFCATCGAPAAPQAGGTASMPGALHALTALSQGGLTGVLVGLAVGAAERFVQSRVQGGAAPIDSLIQHFTGSASGPPVTSSPAPVWYEQAFQEGQPRMDPTEVARRQAAAQARARQGAKQLQAAMDSSHQSVMAILKNMGS